MGFDKWPKAMVLPEAKDFMHGEWECGSRGCAAGWVSTAFGEPVSLPPYGVLNHIPKGTPAAEFAALLAKELGPGAKRRFDRTIRDCQSVTYALSDAFEHTSISKEDMAAAWERAARRKGYVPMGRFK